MVGSEWNVFLQTTQIFLTRDLVILFVGTSSALNSFKIRYGLKPTVLWILLCTVHNVQLYFSFLVLIGIRSVESVKFLFQNHKIKWANSAMKSWRAIYQYRYEYGPILSEWIKLIFKVKMWNHGGAMMSKMNLTHGVTGALYPEWVT